MGKKHIFQYEITAPEGISNTADYAPNIIDDLILTGALTIPIGSCFGILANLFQPDYTLQLIGLGASATTAIAWGWLCAEHNQRLKRVLPWFMTQKANWVMGKELAAQTDEVTLTIDSRNEYDGFTSRYFGPLPVKVERFNLWAMAAVNGQSIAINKWTGGGKEFDRYTEYQPLLEMMLNAGVLVKSGKGNILTHTGKRTLRQHLKAYPPTPFHERV
jgi:hypothetical protein